MKKNFVFLVVLFGVLPLPMGCARDVESSSNARVSASGADRVQVDNGKIQAGAAGSTAWQAKDKAQGKAQGRAGHDDDHAQPVQVAAAISQDVPLELDALGTVIAHNTALVRARVDGPLLRVNFQEGQMVKAGDLLAQIDPHPYQIALDQALGQLQQDEAKLNNARLDAARYRDLLAKNSIARQEVETQEALVHQYEGVVASSRAQVANARLQLGYTRITAPISGRLGLRQLDVGNLVRASDSTGLVSITQTRPINVVFAVPASEITRIEQAARRQGKSGRLRVEAWDREAGQPQAIGHLLTVDNQIDPQTATVRLKAEFANRDGRLFPNQFVLARLTVGQLRDALTIPVVAVQQGSQGSYVYVVEKSAGRFLTVALRPVKTGVRHQERIVIESGLQADEAVVIDGVDKLRAGARIEIPAMARARGRETGTTPPSAGDGQQPLPRKPVHGSAH